MSIVKADLDEIVFEHRNKDYGAYEMRTKYNRFLMRAALVAFLLFLFVTALPKVIEWVTWEEEVAPPPPPPQENTRVVMTELPPPDLEEEEIEETPPPDVPPPPPPQRAQIEFRVPTPTPDEEVEEEATLADIEAIDSIDVGLETVEGDPDADTYLGDIDGIGDGPVEVVVVEEKPKEIGPDDFVLLEKEPAPVNMDNLKQLIGYPLMAKEAEIEGKVILRVQVDKNGKYVRHVVKKDPHPILTKAVTDKIHNLQFTPGIQAGKPIKVWVTIPFDFKLTR